MPAKLVALLLIAFGALGLMYGGFRFAYPDRVVDVGPVHVSVQKHKTVYVPPLLGGLALAGGIVVLATSRKAA
jgi:hypothetical protein